MTSISDWKASYLTFPIGFRKKFCGTIWQYRTKMIFMTNQMHPQTNPKREMKVTFSIFVICILKVTLLFKVIKNWFIEKNYKTKKSRDFPEISYCIRCKNYQVFTVFQKQLSGTVLRKGSSWNVKINVNCLFKYSKKFSKNCQGGINFKETQGSLQLYL